MNIILKNRVQNKSSILFCTFFIMFAIIKKSSERVAQIR